MLKLNVVNGYATTYLYKNNNKTSFSVHRLVAEAFIPNPDSLPQVNHKDENKLNNCVDNLEWCTSKYNVNYSVAKPVLCVETGMAYNSMTEACDKNNINITLLCRVCNSEKYKAGGYHWKFL